MRRMLAALVVVTLACSDSPAELEVFGVTVEGRIEDATGTPVEGWQVRTQLYTSADCTGSIFGAGVSTVTAADGTFSLDIPHPRAEPVCLLLISNDTTTGVPFANSPSPTAQVEMKERPYDVVELDITLPP